MNYDLKTTQTELAERKTEEIFKFLSRNCERPQPPRDIRHPAVLRRERKATGFSSPRPDVRNFLLL